MDLAKKNFRGFKEISNDLSFKYMEFVLTRNHFCNWCWSSNYWDFFNKKKSSRLKKVSAVSFLRTLGYLYEVFEIPEKSTSAKKVALRDAKEDVDKICIEVQKNEYLNLQISSLVGSFKKINAFLVISICFHKTIHNKWCLDKIVGQIENHLERGFVKHWLDTKCRSEKPVWAFHLHCQKLNRGLS